jgi:hypothetical protein
MAQVGSESAFAGSDSAASAGGAAAAVMAAAARATPLARRTTEGCFQDSRRGGEGGGEGNSAARSRRDAMGGWSLAFTEPEPASCRGLVSVAICEHLHTDVTDIRVQDSWACHVSVLF